VSAQLGDAARRLLDGVNVGHLATLMPDGAPKVEPVWVARDGDRVLVTTDSQSIKARNAVRDARVALSVTAADDPYEQLLVRGRVVEIRPDDDLSVLDAMSRKYLDGPFPRRRWSRRAVLVIEPDLARHRRAPLRQPARGEAGPAAANAGPSAGSAAGPKAGPKAGPNAGPGGAADTPAQPATEETPA
jgi:PPOX class probable F420-dependent enzyme